MNAALRLVALNHEFANSIIKPSLSGGGGLHLGVTSSSTAKFAQQAACQAAAC